MITTSEHSSVYRVVQQYTVHVHVQYKVVLACTYVNCGVNISNYTSSVVVRLSHPAVQRSRKAPAW